MIRPSLQLFNVRISVSLNRINCCFALSIYSQFIDLIAFMEEEGNVSKKCMPPGSAIVEAAKKAHKKCFGK